MAQLDRTSDLYQKYIKKFSEQEDQIETIRASQKKIQAQQSAARKALNEFIQGLDIS